MANGTLYVPHLTVTLSGNALNVTIPSLGLALNNGVLASNFTDESLNLTTLNCAGNTSTISATSTVIVGNTFAANSILAPKLNLNLQADNFTAPSHTDRYTVLRDKGNAFYENDLVTLNLQPTKAGVKISGTMLQAVVKLDGDSEVSESDKHSVLVIGQPMSSTGLDSVNMIGSDASTFSLSIGKRITNHVYLGDEKSLFGLLNVAKLTYKLTKRISLDTRAGSESAVDLIYRLDFD